MGGRIEQVECLIRALDMPDTPWHHQRMSDLDRNDIAELLTALGELLGSRGQRYELVLVGGASLLLRGVISRPTRDADVVAGRRGGRLVPMPSLPEDLDLAVRSVAHVYGVAPNWLNTGPQTLMDLGLPDGFEARLDRRDFAPGLVVWLAGRFDLVCLKLYAASDEWPTRGRHLQDLRALAPDPTDLQAAARWARGHDPSPGFRDAQLVPVLGEFGVQFDDGQ
jgi:hypothetical protein